MSKRGLCTHDCSSGLTKSRTVNPDTTGNKSPFPAHMSLASPSVRLTWKNPNPSCIHLFASFTPVPRQVSVAGDTPPCAHCYRFKPLTVHYLQRSSCSPAIHSQFPKPFASCSLRKTAAARREFHKLSAHLSTHRRFHPVTTDELFVF